MTRNISSPDALISFVVWFCGGIIMCVWNEIFMRISYRMHKMIKIMIISSKKYMKIKNKFIYPCAGVHKNNNRRRTLLVYCCHMYVQSVWERYNCYCIFFPHFFVTFIILMFVNFYHILSTKLYDRVIYRRVSWFSRTIFICVC